MKNNIKYIDKLLVALALILMVSCDTEEFLDRSPREELPGQDVFNNSGSIRTYAWQFYDAFPAYDQRGWYGGTDQVHGSKSTIQLRRGVSNLAMWADNDSDLMMRGGQNTESDWIWNRVDTPNSSYDYSAAYQNIRAINLMLDGLEKSTALQEAELNHWKAVGLFFRAYNHSDLLNRYGDIVYVDELLNDASDELYAARTPRDEVASMILGDLIWARDHVESSFNEHSNAINRDAINAFISRFGLREGTWRKYHGLGEVNKYLEASVAAGEELLPKYQLHPNYDEVFNSEDLSGVNGIILYKRYEEGITVHRTTQETRNGNAGEDLTKKAADLYLMTDGQTRWTSTLFEGDDSFNAETRNRDLRFYYTITPPYIVDLNGGQWNPTANPSDAEFFPFMESLSDDLHKTLPSDDWRGSLTRAQPNFVLNPLEGWNTTATGYRCWKFYNRLVTGNNNVDINDAPIFRIGEVMVNYAEAMYELGRFNQTVADETINLLRDRGGVAHLAVGAEPSDPTRDSDITPTLWEIRRERAIELMAEGFRFDDIRRWRKGSYLNEQKLGRWIDKTSTNLNTGYFFSSMPIQNGADKGYIAMDGVPPVWPEYYYLQPIPINELILNSNLTQNPGWEQ
ncbi:Starch-binding associating with outer membrane [Zhouia amylolytica]|uniref:Starch-binding associating with outer membrane n=1 Tax=Zhouia amylolytica TaxID=376730 RepID=A0A1I6V3H3_9FLAO|nr:RagB/SusD family nutrient uptake outer membrane protein [Zhouia amylolytica]SFT08238.1 Starch-binding associating with outer membrane [Zhouia amylolytica]